MHGQQNIKDCIDCIDFTVFLGVFHATR